MRHIGRPALHTSTTFGGDVSGKYNATVVADDSHNHIVGNVDGLQTALDAKASKSGDTFTGNVIVNQAGNSSGVGLRVSNALESSSGIHSHGFSGTFLNTFNNANAHGVAIGSKHADSNSLIVGGHDTAFDHFVVKGDGKVGIGTTAPQDHSLLHVKGDMGGEPYCGIVSEETNTSTGYGGFQAKAVKQAHYRYAINGNNKFQTRVGQGTGADKWSLYSWTQSADVLLCDGASGSIGINTTTPSSSYKLDVNGSARFGGPITNSGYRFLGHKVYTLDDVRDTDTTYYKILLPQTYQEITNGGHVKITMIWRGSHASSSATKIIEFSYGTHHSRSSEGYLTLSPYTLIHDSETENSYGPYDITPGFALYRGVVENNDGDCGAILKVTGRHSSYNLRFHLRVEVTGDTHRQTTITDMGSSLESGAVAITERKVWNSGNDGSGSGLDADTLDGIQASSFLRSDAADTGTGPLQINGTGQYVGGWGYNTIILTDTSGYPGIDFRHSTKDWLQRMSGGTDMQWAYRDNSNYTERMKLTTGGVLTVNSNTVWNAGNDGSGSGLDADTVDGIQGGNFLRSDTSDEFNGTLTIKGYSQSGGQNRSQAIYIGKDNGANDAQYFTMGWKANARSGEVWHTKTGNGFYIEAGSSEAGGFALDEDGMHIYSSGDGGQNLRVIDKDSDVVQFSVGQADGQVYIRNYLVIGGHITPSADNTKDLGSSSNRWRNIYTADLQLSNMDTGGNDVDGTEGSWTIQEGSEDLYIINRQTGRKFKFNLIEV